MVRVSSGTDVQGRTLEYICLRVDFRVFSLDFRECAEYGGIEGGSQFFAVLVLGLVRLSIRAQIVLFSVGAVLCFH